jgi:hypothetical protein
MDVFAWKHAAVDHESAQIRNRIRLSSAAYGSYVQRRTAEYRVAFPGEQFAGEFFKFEYLFACWYIALRPAGTRLE